MSRDQQRGRKGAHARLLPSEIEADERWDLLIGDSTETLAALADEALAEHRAGKTRPFPPAVTG